MENVDACHRHSDAGFTALNPETATASQGNTLAEAMAHLREAVELYLEVFLLKLGGAPDDLIAALR